jgi:hypothetical protein
MYGRLTATVVVLTLCRKDQERPFRSLNTWLCERSDDADFAIGNEVNRALLCSFMVESSRCEKGESNLIRVEAQES